MGLVSPQQSNAGETIEASDINNPINQLATVINGGIDATNLADNAVSSAKLAAGAVTAAKLQYGLVRSRQGGTSGAAAWRSSGSTTTDTTTTGVFIQVGAIGTSTGGDITVTFPTAYTQIPLVIACVSGGNAGTGGVTQNAFAVINTVSATAFTVRSVNDAGSASDQSVSWIAIGQ